MVEWWRDDETIEDAARPRPSMQETEQRRLQAVVWIVASIVVCVALGWLAGPLLARFIEGLTGTPADDTGALRSLGAFFGLLTGIFFGALAGWVTWNGR